MKSCIKFHFSTLRELCLIKQCSDKAQTCLLALPKTKRELHYEGDEEFPRTNTLLVKRDSVHEDMHSKRFVPALTSFLLS
jgi:hypothetical protein